MNRIKGFTIIASVAAGAAHATLPPPPEPAKQAAAEAAAKTAWQDKVAAYKLCLVQDQVADRYRKEAKSEGKTAPAPMTTAACQDPGPFVSPMAQKPLESSGAHSPAGTATTPPSQNATAAETMGSKKPQ
jgi:hypothetical protein